MKMPGMNMMPHQKIAHEFLLKKIILNMRKYFTLSLLFFCVTGFLQSQTTAAYQKLVFIKGTDTLPYRLLLPENYNTSNKYPLILFLHGAGERGNDNEAQLVHGASLFLRDSIRKRYPSIVLFPQCPADGYWSNVKAKNSEKDDRDFQFQVKGKPTTAMALLQKLLMEILNTYPVDRSRIYVGGLSMGGMGTFEIVARNPYLFAAAFPICGGADVSAAKKLVRTSWWVFHGAKDDVVLPRYSERIVRALQELKANVTFSLYPDANHNSWDQAFAEPALFSWMFSNTVLRK
jgi:predicted peptidase